VALAGDQERGPGDYLIGTPTFTLLELKALPEFKWLFEQTLRLGTYVGSPIRKFTFSDEGARRTFGYVPDDAHRGLFRPRAGSGLARIGHLQGRLARRGGAEEVPPRLLGSDPAPPLDLPGARAAHDDPVRSGMAQDELYDPWMAARRQPSAHRRRQLPLDRQPRLP
jgi:hypothetical protein